MRNSNMPCTSLLNLLFLTLILFNSLRTSGSPSPSLSLDGALTEGRGHSPILQSALAKAREASWKETESMAGFLPQLTVSGSHFFNHQYEMATINIGAGPLIFPFIYPLTTLSFDAKLNLFDGFKNIYNFQAAGLNHQAEDQEAQWADFNLTQNIRIKFYEAIAAQKLAAVADQNLRTLEDHLKKIKIRRSGGVATR